jgi:mono/diheme cytochrome c family protein
VSRPRLRWRAIAAAGFAGLGALVLTACDLQTNADLERGATLFRQKCGTCHALAALGGGPNIGPNLDAAFAESRSKGYDADTIEGVVQGQIENPREITLDPSDPGYARVFMPANLVEGQDAEDVAAYVASVAGVPGVEPPKLPGGPGAQVFVSSGCGNCHTMKALGDQAAGAVGPVLDDVVPGQSPADLEKSITDPNAAKSPGFEDAVMPAFSSLGDQDLQDLIDFLLKIAGQDAGAKQ